MTGRTTRQRTSGSGGDLSADWGPLGLQVTDARPRPVWGKITGQAAGTNRYAWSQVSEVDEPTFPVFAGGFGLSGTSAVGGTPAYEIGGRQDVPLNTVVRLDLSPSAEYWTFSYQPPNTAGITVEEVDGSPSYTSVSTLRFDQADGFQLSQPGAGIARVDLVPATTTQAGGVSTSTQNWAGDKRLASGFYFYTDIDYGAGFGGYVRVGPVYAVDNVFGGGIQGQYVVSTGPTVTAAGALHFDRVGGKNCVVLSGGDATNPSAYGIREGFGGPSVAGVSGSLAGVTATGGIVTALASTGIPIPSMADAAAALNTLYFSTTASRLVYKDGAGVVNNLY